MFNQVLKLPGVEPAHAVHSGIGFRRGHVVHTIGERSEQIEAIRILI